MARKRKGGPTRKKPKTPKKKADLVSHRTNERLGRSVKKKKAKVDRVARDKTRKPKSKVKPRLANSRRGFGNKRAKVKSTNKKAGRKGKKKAK